MLTTYLCPCSDPPAGDDGTPRQVTDLVTGIDKLYSVKIVGDKSDSLVVTGNHILVLRRHRSETAAFDVPAQIEHLAEEGAICPNPNARQEILEITVEDYLKLPAAEKAEWHMYIADSLTFGHDDDDSDYVDTYVQKLAIDPYFLGLWLGNGTERAADAADIDESELVDYLRRYAVLLDMKRERDADRAPEQAEAQLESRLAASDSGDDTPDLSDGDDSAPSDDEVSLNDEIVDPLQTVVDGTDPMDSATGEVSSLASHDERVKARAAFAELPLLAKIPPPALTRADADVEGLGAFANLKAPVLTDKELVEVIDRVLGYPQGASSASSTEGLEDIEALRRTQLNKLLDALRTLGVSPKIGEAEPKTVSKHIPDAYKRGPQRVRLAVFAGMIDSGGCLVHYEKENGVKDRQFYLSPAREGHERLISDLDFVGRSLGFQRNYQVQAAQSELSGRGSSRGEQLVGLWTGKIDQVPTLFGRKQASAGIEEGDEKIRRFEIERQTVVESYFGFKVNGNQRFLRDDFLVLHNSGFEVRGDIPCCRQTSRLCLDHCNRKA